VIHPPGERVVTGVHGTITGMGEFKLQHQTPMGRVRGYPMSQAARAAISSVTRGTTGRLVGPDPQSL
jgi:hypothetical protein